MPSRLGQFLISLAPTLNQTPNNCELEVVNGRNENLPGWVRPLLLKVGVYLLRKDQTTNRDGTS